MRIQRLIRATILAILVSILPLIVFGGQQVSDELVWKIPAKHMINATTPLVVGQAILIPPKEQPNLFSTIGEPLSGIKFSNGPDREVILRLYRPNEELRPSAFAELLERANSFWIRPMSDRIEIYASDRQGLIYAVDTLAQMLIESKGSLAYSEIVDAPGLQFRGLHVVMRMLTVDQLKKVINRARRMRFNGLVLDLRDTINFESDAVVPGSNSISKDQFLEVVSYARQSGMDVIPEVKLLTKQQWFFKNAYPNLLFNKFTYDPRKPEVYELVFGYLNELIDLIQPKAIHIGHDELAGIRSRQGMKESESVPKILPPELFLDDVEQIVAFLQRRNVATWMWGDMLLAPNEFPSMDAKNLHGILGYSKLRAQLPKSIVITDWHYWDTGSEFPSAQAFAAAGHDVIGSTWKRTKTIQSFSRYVASMPSHAKGMLATTWVPLQRGDWDVVDQIIIGSGRNYWLVEKD